MIAPWIVTPPLDRDVFRNLRLDAMFECHKWDPQHGDAETLAPFPIVLRSATWRELSRAAERLAEESLALEIELSERPDLVARLGLPAEVRSCWPRWSRPAVQCDVRVIRFDFHFTPDGWRISEANTDVPGGYSEATCFTRLVAQFYPDAVPLGDPVEALCARVGERVAAGSPVACVYATAHAEDRQVSSCLARGLAAAGFEPHLVSPANIRWDGGRASLETASARTPLGAVFRYFPAEWLPNLPRSQRWPVHAQTVSCNSISALLSQSKRTPLVWDEVQTKMTTWRALLPECRDPRDTRGDEDGWVLKPAFGRVGENVGIAGVTPPAVLRSVQRKAGRRPDDWVAQRRFEATAFESALGPVYPCVGVYTVNGRAAGAYGRIGRYPLVDAFAMDAAVLVERLEER